MTLTLIDWLIIVLYMAGCLVAGLWMRRRHQSRTRNRRADENAQKPDDDETTMLIDAHNHIGADLFFYLHGFNPYAQDLPALATEGGRQGIDRWVVFPMAAHRIHCEGAAVLHALAEAYPKKLVWGSDTPFQSYVAREADGLLSLRSTYAEEIACLRAMSAASQTAIAHDNTLAFLRLNNSSALQRPDADRAV